MSKVLPYCGEALFYDNDNCFVVVAEYRNGVLQGVGEAKKQLADGTTSLDVYGYITKKMLQDSANRMQKFYENLNKNRSSKRWQ